jgi:hypothetical protein
MARLPRMIAHQLAYWALAEHKIDTLAKQRDYEPHWENTCLHDAFLRGWPLPSQDEELNAALERWYDRWRPLALLTLSSALREQELTLADVAVENTVFRVLEINKDHVTLGLLHIWDPHFDQLPKVRNGATLFRPAFGVRKRYLASAEVAQRHAMAEIQRVRAASPDLAGILRRSLSLDSGGAVDFLLEYLCRPFVKKDLAVDIRRVMRQAATRVDPLVTSGLKKRLASRHDDFLVLAKEFGQQGEIHGAVPDFLAWELHLIGSEIKIVASVLWKSVEDALASRRGLNPPYLNRQPHGRRMSTNSGDILRHMMSQGVDISVLREMSNRNVWEIIRNIVASNFGQTAQSALKILERPCPYTDIADRIRTAYRLLRAKDPKYAAECVRNDVPRPSSRLESGYAPGCLRGWDRVCFDIAEGDKALGLAWTIRAGSSLTEKAALDNLRKAAQNFDIPDVFTEIEATRDRLVRSLDSFQKQPNQVNLDSAAGTVRQTLMDLLSLSEASYKHAASRDHEYGCAWVRLARLKWLSAHYAEALSIVAGPIQNADLHACQLPLALAVRAAGGHISLPAAAGCSWKRLKARLVAASRSESGDLLLAFSEESTPIGSCVVSGLAERDMSTLEQFFNKYGPDMLKDTKAHTLEEWIQDARVPSLGQRAALADVVQGDIQFAVLAACVHLGVPGWLGLPPGVSTKPRNVDWLKEEVVARLEWG